VFALPAPTTGRDESCSAQTAVPSILFFERAMNASRESDVRRFVALKTKAG
jgi:hypothetical protein